MTGYLSKRIIIDYLTRRSAELADIILPHLMNPNLKEDALVQLVVSVARKKMDLNGKLKEHGYLACAVVGAWEGYTTEGENDFDKVRNAFMDLEFTHGDGNYRKAIRNLGKVLGEYIKYINKQRN